MRTVSLTQIQAGMSRLRLKGGARPTSLYDLKNAYVSIEGTVLPRPGCSRNIILPSNTKGLVAFDGGLHTFSTIVQTLTDPYVNHVLAHPTDTTAVLVKIHFAKPFMGALYVVAEWDDGSVFHYWLSSSGTWTANTIYKIGDIIEPTTPNGLAYVVERVGNPNPLWTANISHAVNDLAEPTVYNGFYFKVTSTDGANPHSGATEPSWIASEGAVTNEDADSIFSTSVATAVDPTSQVPTAVKTRYSNPAGG